MSILEEIQNQFPEFSEKEKQIATYLLQNSETIKNINISELAKLTHSSPATITRFAKKMNSSSFVDLKIRLNSSNASEPEKMSLKKADQIYEFYSKVIENTRKITKKKQIETVVELIEKAERILILGVGSSGLTATELTQRLLRMGINVTSITDPHFMIISSSIATKNDLVIGISTSGETNEVVSSMNLAKKSGATIVSLTSFSNSQIAQLSDISLVSYSSSFVDNKRFINSQFATMYIVDIISTLLLEKEAYSYKMDRTIDVITKSLEDEF
ncbi:MurR/RpiR family transcriptional regulator [Vagococcus sp. BWB3-3]|uniref:MurR/RpiR family transcriptional regulator n=1 Tax=Vagococcus allomyrinae TaxID=2794353 RepID=A0A940PCL3_9ENTE|nr:MurR/RpiR family transcriptional regulator [Vagococcus allomyrinae]MBP1043606.1 MurR/RpiR family transcriptional regulator [Vagococcus allomyrinae]